MSRNKIFKKGHSLTACVQNKNCKNILFVAFVKKRTYVRTTQYVFMVRVKKRLGKVNLFSNIKCVSLLAISKKKDHF